ncbi:BRO1 domain-containing protein [Aphelenchoides besseyi]|nr:BRO1 domain-containing protein [Aphelenchoides besseyi]
MDVEIPGRLLFFNAFHDSSLDYMGKRSLLAVPAKPASDVDIASRVSSYMQTCLSLTPEVTNAVKEGLDELNRLRRNAFFARRIYYDCFSALSDKIQIKDAECPVPFRWKSAFDKGGLFSGKRDLTLNYSGYEKACVLFNIAAYQSKYAANVELSSDENMRQAVRYFQSSANIFELLKNDIMHLVPEELPRDLQPQLLNALAQLMITQANEIMYAKALKDGNSPAALRAIAMQLSDMYGVTYKLFNYEQARGIVDKSWYLVIQGKEAAYQAYGTKHHFEELESGKLDTIEERLARAREVLELFEKADHIHPKTYDDDVRAAKVTWEKIEKDNNLIYHSRIPSKTELPAIPRKLVLNFTQVKFPLSKDFKDIFVQLVSVHVNKAVNLFQGQLKERVHALVSDLRTHVNNTKAGLASINMPALIEDELKQERIPASIIKKAEDIRSKGGFHMIETHERDLAQATSATIEQIKQIKQKLADEEESDTALREHYGARWSCTGSAQLTMKFKVEIGKYSGINDTAMAANTKVKSKIRLCERDVTVMTGPRDELEKRVPPITNAGGDQTQAVAKLRELMAVMDKELSKVSNIETRLNDLRYDPTTDFLGLLKKDGSLEDAKVLEFTTSKLNTLLGSLEKEVSENKDLRTNVLEEMKVWHQKFSSGGSTDDSRSRALQQLAAAYDTFLECDANLQEGIKFYNDLRVLLTRLQQQVDDFCFARKTEKEDLLSVLEPGKNSREVMQTVVENYKKKAGGSSNQPIEHHREAPPRPQPPARPPPPSNPNTSTMTRAPEMQNLNISENNQSTQNWPNNPPSIPPHQQSYMPNVPTSQPMQQQNYNWYQPGFQYPQQPQYQMPHLPFYGAYQANVQSNQPYAAPYPMYYPPQHPMPNQFPPQQQPNQQNQHPSGNTNPFAQ